MGTGVLQITLKTDDFDLFFIPILLFSAAPGMEEMQSVYNNLRVSNAMSVANTNLNTFERNSSIRNSSKRAQTLASMSSLYVEEDVMKNLEESARLQRAFSNYFDLVVVNESHEQTFRQVMDAWLALSVMDQWVPSTWVYS